MAEYDTGRGGDGYDNFAYEGNEPKMGQFDFNNNNNNENNYEGGTGYNEKSLQLDKVFEEKLENQKFQEKEAEYSRKIEEMIDKKVGKKITSNWPKVVYLGNKLLMGMILFASLLDRFDVVGLTVCFIIFFLEIQFFNPKHLYKWVAVMICSIAIDVLVFLDILFVSAYNLIF